MKYAYPLCLSLIVASMTSVAGELTRLSLDDASSISLQIATDSEVKSEGAGSLRITTQWPTTINLGEVSELNVEGATLVYSAKVKASLEGAAFLEMWVEVAGRQYFSRGLNDAVQGSSDWRSIQTPFVFEPGQRPTKVTLNLVINGKGTVWIDDIVLSKRPSR